MNHYDAIFREILNSNRCQAVFQLTGTDQYSLRPTHAGWRTGRSVDFLAEVTARRFLHIEIQSTNDDTMHWRMVNYYVLLNNRLHEWKNDKFTIEQFMFYVGSKSMTMLETHPKFGAPYEYTAKNIDSVDLSTVMESDYYGDWAIGLLGKGIKLGDWMDVFDKVCALPDEHERLSGLFFLEQLAPLREAKEMIDQRLEETDLLSAIEESKTTGFLADKVTLARSIELLNDYFKYENASPVMDEEQLILQTVGGAEAWRVAREIALRGEHRHLIAELGRSLDLI